MRRAEGIGPGLRAGCGHFVRGKRGVEKVYSPSFAIRQTFCITQDLNTVNILVTDRKLLRRNSLASATRWHDPRFRVGHN
jgi:hypothetical protein